jgi:hypothetical protein
LKIDLPRKKRKKNLLRAFFIKNKRLHSHISL